MMLTLSARPPFSLSTVLNSHGWIQLAPFSQINHTVGFKYVDRLNTGQVVEMRIEETEIGVKVEVDAQLHEAEQVEIIRKINWMLGLDQDFSAFYKIIQREPKLARVSTLAQGRVLRSPTLFEDVVKTILTTNTSWAGTIRMVENLVSQFGGPLPTNQERCAFPSPEQLAATDIDTLRTQTRLGYRAPYVHELANSIASGDFDLEALKTGELTNLELRKQLLAIKGVGDYAAANLLMLLGRYDYIPVDSWATKMVSHEWYGGQPIDSNQVEAAFEHWEDWKGLVFWFWDWSYSS